LGCSMRATNACNLYLSGNHPPSPRTPSVVTLVLYCAFCHKNVTKWSITRIVKHLQAVHARKLEEVTAG